MLPLKNLGCFQIFAFGIGMIYFAHRYLSIYNGDKTYVTLLRGADIAFFILMQFYWLHYLQKSIQIVSEKIKKADVFLKNPIFKKTSAILYAANSAGSQINFFHIFHI